MKSGFFGKHYETGTIANALAAAGHLNPKMEQPWSEAMVLGASGGIAFGYFVFEYTGQLPHVALLPRNTFSPFERALDNLAIRRERRETTDPAKGEKNLRLELDSGNPVIVWADIYSLPYKGLNPEEMWVMAPLLVVGVEGDDFWVVDGTSSPFILAAEDLAKARARVKKDRFRTYVLEAPDESRVGEGLRAGIHTCVSLFLDAPPAGSKNNFGISGMRYFAQMLTDDKTAKGWGRTFAPGPRLVQALAGRQGQPGVWQWIQTFGTSDAADRETYASFLEEAGNWLDVDFAPVANLFRDSASLWRSLADAAMPNEIPEFRRLKELRLEESRQWREKGCSSLSSIASRRAEMAELTTAAASSEVLIASSRKIREEMARLILQIAEIEEAAARELRTLVANP